MNAPIPAWVDGVLGPVPEIEVHRRGLQHRAVAVFVTRGSRVLIRQRSPAAYLAPGLWSSACHAHLAWGEAPEACAARLARADAPAAAGAPHWRGMVEYHARLSEGFVEHECVEVFLIRDASPTSREGDEPAGAPSEGAWGNAHGGEHDWAHGHPARWPRAGPPDAIWIEVEDLLIETRRRAERFTPWLHVALSRHLPLILN